MPYALEWVWGGSRGCDVFPCFWCWLSLAAIMCVVGVLGKQNTHNTCSSMCAWFLSAGKRMNEGKAGCMDSLLRGDGVAPLRWLQGFLRVNFLKQFYWHNELYIFNYNLMCEIITIIKTVYTSITPERLIVNLCSVFAFCGMWFHCLTNKIVVTWPCAIKCQVCGKDRKNRWLREALNMRKVNPQ